MCERNSVYIKDLSDVSGLCRICLTGSRKMISLRSELEHRTENDIRLVYQALERVTTTKVPCDERYPSYVCAMCMGILNIVYDFKLQFEQSQKLLSEYFGEYPVKVSNDEKCQEKDDSVKTDDVTVYSVVPVELISKQGRYDLKDLIIIEDENETKPNYDGFLKNLGKEVSASFVNAAQPEKQEHNVVSENTVSVTKINRLNNDMSQHNALKEKRNIKTTANEIENLTESNIIIELAGSDIENFFEDNKISEYFDDSVKKNVKIMSKRVECPHCKKIYSNKRNLNRHISEMHAPTKYNYLCQLCGHAAKTKSGLYNHNISKHNDKRFACEICGKRYLYASNLQQHTIAVHENERNYLCTICGKNFNYSNALEYHMRLHTGEKKYNCPYCDRKFTMQCGLKRHVRTHTGVRPFKCKYCEKAFRSKGEVSCHEMLHTGYRPYHCKYCGKGFTKTHNMKVHIMGHAGPHHCEICSRTFIDISCLKTHLKTVHGLSDEIVESTEV